MASLALPLGLLAGVDPRLAVAASLGLAFVGVVLADLTVGLCLFVFLAPLDNFPELGGSALTFTKALGLLLAVSWLAASATMEIEVRSFVSQHPAVSYGLLLFLVWVGLSVLWAGESSEVLASFSRYAPNILLLLIVYAAVRRRKHVLWLAGSFVAGVSVAAAYALAVPPDPEASSDTIERVSGTLGDPNELAALLVAGLILAIALATALRRRPSLRLAAVVAAGLCLAGVFLTVSRGGLVALACSLLAAAVFGGPWRRTAVVAASLAALAGAAYLGAQPEVSERVLRLEGGTGRTDIWKVGWRMVEDQPVAGVGAGNFQASSVDYLLQPGAILRDEFIVDEPKAAHNTYLQILAELGVVGLGLFLAVVGFSLASAIKAARAFGRVGDVEMDALARGAFVALVGLLVAYFFISEQFGKQLWLLLGFAPSLLAVARAMQAASGESVHGGDDRDDDTRAYRPPAGHPALGTGSPA